MQFRLTIMFDAFLDNLSGVALFGKLRWPGAPTEMIDSRTAKEYVASREFDETVYRYQGAVAQLRRKRERTAVANEREEPVHHLMSR